MERERPDHGERLIACTRQTAAERHYWPVLLGNGDLSLQIDPHGTMDDSLAPGLWNGGGAKLRIRRAGCRYDSPGRELVSFGWFRQAVAGAGECVDWTQSLDVARAVATCRCRYARGTVIETGVFCHLERNVIAIRKRVVEGPLPDYGFEFAMDDSPRLSATCDRERFSYDVDHGHLRGVLGVHGTGLAWRAPGSFGGTLREAALFIAFDEDELAWSVGETFESLLTSHTAAWRAYWEESYVRIPDRRVQQVYDTAQYTLRVSSTRWSIPVGLLATHWQGRYFAFDESFCALALLSSGHLGAARKVAAFRHACLPEALRRASQPGNGAARFHWETLEDFSEGSPAGYWIEHIFHMASVAMTCFLDYRYSGDLGFLRDKGYPVIRACALFFEQMATAHRADGAAIVGRCTDLERLGGGRENAFMTTCGAIATLDAAARAAATLGIDDELARQWGALASALRLSLPHDGRKYVPFPGCDQKSIAVYSGIYPYAALPADDAKLRAAIDDFDAGGGAFGNMYKLGSGLCTWYAAWKAVIRARLGDGDTALQLLRRAAVETGCFAESFEIYEANLRPWFNTSAGVWIQAVNDLLLQVDGDGGVRLAPAVPAEWRAFAFRLQGPGGQRIEAAYRDGKPFGKGFHVRPIVAPSRLSLRNGLRAQKSQKAVPGH